jgi:hypothetical protein
MPSKFAGQHVVRLVEFAGDAHAVPTPWNCPCGQAEAVVITQCVPVVPPYAVVFGGRQHAPLHGFGLHEVVPGSAVYPCPVHAYDGTTRHPPLGSQHGTGHGLGVHVVYGPSHDPRHPSGLVYEQTRIGGPEVENSRLQHAPPHGYGLHVARFGMKYAECGHWPGDDTAMHCPLG